MRYLKLFSPVVVAFVVALMPTPSGLSDGAWLYFAVFLGVIVGLVTEPVPAALVGLVGVVLLTWLKLGPVGSGDPGSVVKSSSAIKWALSGFSNPTVFLIFSAFMMSMGYEKSGLGKRIALVLVKYLGKSTLGLGYAVTMADCVLAPFMPSNSSRSCGTLYPIISSIPPIMGSHPDNGPSARKVGAYLSWTALAAVSVTSSMFLTAVASNLLALDLAVGAGFAGVSWFGWFISFAPCGVILLLSSPLLAYLVYPPTVKRDSAASEWAASELLKMGGLSYKEWVMIFLALFALISWVGYASFGVNPTTVAVTVVVMLVLLGVISWDDVLSCKSAWNLLTWFASLVVLSAGLKNVGFLDWLGTIIGGLLSGYSSPTYALVGVVVLFYLIHYFFASTTAQVTALLVTFIVFSSNINGVDSNQVVLLLMLPIGIMGILTPYGSGPNPIWYGSGYIKPSDFWFLGTVFGMYYLVVFLLVCVPWVTMYSYRFIG